MKYGENFANESVPEWSIHNIDYNSLKHHIKAHTTKGQAKAIAIPGHQDVALNKFETEFYNELCRQHDRAGLFVNCKAAELTRRLQDLSDRINNVLRQSARRRISPKRQRKLARLDQEVVQCGDEVRDLSRFVSAQVVAFRKILKKYKKWTGSSHLTGSFREKVLSSPKSFTNRDFHALEAHCADLLSDLRASNSPADSGPTTPVDSPATPSRRRSVQLPGQPIVVAKGKPGGGYWNEYDHGSENGDVEEGYAIFINPENEDTAGHVPGISTLMEFFSMPVEKAKAWLGGGRHDGAEHDPLLPGAPQMAQSGGPYGSVLGAPTHPSENGHLHDNTSSTADGYSAGGDDDEDEDDGEAAEDCASEEAFFPRGYDTVYAALPSINEQRVAQYRDRVLMWGTAGADAAAMVFLLVASVLIFTGRHRLRVEVDAGVVVGSVASLGCACAALGMTLARGRQLTWTGALVVYATFTAICVLNGILLVLVMGNTALSTVFRSGSGNGSLAVVGTTTV